MFKSLFFSTLVTSLSISVFAKPIDQSSLPFFSNLRSAQVSLQNHDDVIRGATEIASMAAIYKFTKHLAVGTELQRYKLDLSILKNAQINPARAQGLKQSLSKPYFRDGVNAVRELQKNADKSKQALLQAAKRSPFFIKAIRRLGPVTGWAVGLDGVFRLWRAYNNDVDILIALSPEEFANYGDENLISLVKKAPLLLEHNVIAPIDKFVAHNPFVIEFEVLGSVVAAVKLLQARKKLLATVFAANGLGSLYGFFESSLAVEKVTLFYIFRPQQWNKWLSVLDYFGFKD